MWVLLAQPAACVNMQRSRTSGMLAMACLRVIGSPVEQKGLRVGGWTGPYASPTIRQKGGLLPFLDGAGTPVCPPPGDAQRVVGLPTVPTAARSHGCAARLRPLEFRKMRFDTLKPTVTQGNSTSLG